MVGSFSLATVVTLEQQPLLVWSSDGGDDELAILLPPSILRGLSEAAPDDEHLYEQVLLEGDRFVSTNEKRMARRKEFVSIDQTFRVAFTATEWTSSCIQLHNNCYNYACDLITNTFAQPGRGGGQVHVTNLCPDVRASALLDRLIDGSAATGDAAGSHLVALASIPGGTDFHWYRRDADGSWSHKPGSLAPRQLDASNQPITNPAACDRGKYTNFCGWFLVNEGSVVIR
jgi:hypothetical protein